MLASQPSCQTASPPVACALLRAVGRLRLCSRSLAPFLRGCLRPSRLRRQKLGQSGWQAGRHLTGWQAGLQEPAGWQLSLAGQVVQTKPGTSDREARRKRPRAARHKRPRRMASAAHPPACWLVSHPASPPASLARCSSRSLVPFCARSLAPLFAVACASQPSSPVSRPAAQPASTPLSAG